MSLAFDPSLPFYFFIALFIIYFLDFLPSTPLESNAHEIGNIDTLIP